MIAATRITRRILRKIAKPVALWLNARQMTRCEHRAEHFYVMRIQSIPMELDERKRQIKLKAQRCDIERW